MIGPAANPTAELHIPDRIQVPAGHRLLFIAYARGVQVYPCPACPVPAPFAILLRHDRSGDDLLAIHYYEADCPVWQALDGSKCLGDIQHARELLSPDPEAISWSLIPTRPASSAGLLSRVSYVQRLFTNGGLLRMETWQAKPEGSPLLVEFSAQFFFYTGT
jgi:hypothetical protein